MLHDPLLWSSTNVLPEMEKAINVISRGMMLLVNAFVSQTAHELNWRPDTSSDSMAKASLIRKTHSVPISDLWLMNVQAALPRLMSQFLAMALQATEIKMFRLGPNGKLVTS